MAAWCLPRSLSNAFLDAIKDGRLSPETLMGMTSAERRTEFGKLVGPENAAEINAQFESKMLLKDQQRGLVNWAQKIAGITEPVRRDILAAIGKLDRVLNPADEKAFLEDLAAKKLGVTVTAEEAKNIFEMSQRAEKVLQDIVAQGSGDYRAGWTRETGTAYGKARLDLIDYMNSLKPHQETFAKGLFKVLNIPRELQTSLFHWSAPFVQLYGMISNGVWYRGLYNQFQYFKSEGAYRDLESYIIGHPDYELAKDGQLGLTRIGDKLTTGEEGLQAHLLSDINQWASDKTGGALPNAIRGWQRSFVGVINYVRFERFTELLQAARMNGEDVSLGSKTVSDLAKVVNNFTGRGTEVDLGVTQLKVNPGQATALNALFYAPRKFIASVEMFNPATVAKLSPTARAAHMRQLAGAMLVTGSIVTLAKMSGAGVDLDPRSSDFLKINIGGEKFDITGGNASYLRFMARMISGQSVTGAGKVLDLDGGNGGHGMTRAEVLTNFARGKLAPIGSIIADALYNQSPGLQPGFTVTKEAQDRLMPIAINSWLQMALNNPTDTAAFIPALSAFVGVGMESPLPPVAANGMNVWGQDYNGFGTPPSWRADPVNQEATRVGLKLSLPMDKIRGQKLDGAQYGQYIQLSGRLAHQRLEALVQSPGWDTIPAPTRLSVMKSAIRKSRDIAATEIMLRFQGTPHDIMKAATDAKLAAYQPVQ